MVFRIDDRSPARVFNADPRLMQKMAPHLQRVMIIDPNPQATRLLSDVLRSITLCQVQSAATNVRAMQLARAFDPQIIFLEYGGPGLDGMALSMALRRSELNCRTVPIIMVTGEATAQAILGARDAGVHEFVRKPFTTKDVLRRLEAVILKHRDWVEAVQYVGPDRRRFNSGDYAGPRKRRSDTKKTPDQAKILQALKIVRSAAGALDSDWPQARRALIAQAVELQRAGVAVGDMPLMEVGAALQRVLIAEGAPDKPTILKAIAEALRFMPKEELAA